MPENAVPIAALRTRLAAAADIPRLIPMINSAFAVEKFFDGTRTDEVRLAAMMGKGNVLVAEDGSGRLLGCVYTEVRGVRGYLGMLAVDPAHQGAGLGKKMMQAAEDHLRRQGCEAVARISHRRIVDCGEGRLEKAWKGRLFMA